MKVGVPRKIRKAAGTEHRGTVASVLRRYGYGPHVLLDRDVDLRWNSTLSIHLYVVAGIHYSVSKASLGRNRPTGNTR
jgi:hypothetical protein